MGKDPERSFGPFTLEDVQHRHGRFLNVVPSFGLEQGTDEGGEPKFRRVENHSACLNNSAAHWMQKIEMANADYFSVVIRSLQETFHEGALIGARDMKGAYRQIPLPDRQFSITAVFDPFSQRCLKSYEKRFLVETKPSRISAPS